MLRILVIRDKDKDTDLRDRLLSAALTSEQADSALEALQALNPHTDIRKPSAGTVLLVPDTPAFKASASVPVLGETFDSFQQLVKSALSNAAENLKAANAARAAERDEVMAVIKRPAVTRILDAAALNQQVADATSAFKEEQTQDGQAEEAVAAASKAALAKLAELSKLLG